MDAKQVMELARANGWLNSPMAELIHGGTAAEQAVDAIDAANLHASADHAQALRDAEDHAQSCIDSRDSWCIDTLTNNIASSFGDDLTEDEIETIASRVLAAQAESPDCDETLVEQLRRQSTGPDDPRNAIADRIGAFEATRREYENREHDRR